MNQIKVTDHHEKVVIEIPYLMAERLHHYLNCAEDALSSRPDLRTSSGTAKMVEKLKNDLDEYIES